MTNIWELSISSSAMILTILVLRKFGRKRISKNAMMVLWNLVLIRALIPYKIYIGEIPTIKEGLEKGFLVNASADILNNYAENSQILVVTGRMQKASTYMQLQKCFMWIWAAGVFCFLVRFIYLYIKEYRMLRGSIPIQNRVIERMIRKFDLHRKIHLYGCRSLKTPVTYGVIFPKIIWPLEFKEATRSDVRNMLAHELEHIRKFDVGKRYLLSIALCIHWFNPLMWLMYRLYLEDQEVACDERVMRRMREREAKSYVYTLIKMTSEERGTVVTLGFGGRNAARKRILEALNERKKGGITLTVCFGICLLLVFGFSGTLEEGPAMGRGNGEAGVTANATERKEDLIEPRYTGFTSMPAYDENFDYHTVKREILENYNDFMEQPTEEQIKMILIQNGIASAKMYKERQKNGYALTADQIWIMEEYYGIETNS